MIGSVAGGVAEEGLTQSQDFLRSDSRFSMKFVGKAKPVIHYPIFIHNRRKQAKLSYMTNGYYTDISS
jgi:hypothetical protein